VVCVTLAGILTEHTPAEGWGLGSGSRVMVRVRVRVTAIPPNPNPNPNPDPNPNPNPITPAEEARVPRSSWERFLLVLRPLAASTASASAFFA
jgi:hypothetical protein